MKEEINKWLINPKRSYALGLSIFLALASTEVKAKYSEYLSSGDDNLSTTDPRFCMLTNKVTDIYNKVKINPDAFKDKALVFETPYTPLVKQKLQVDQIIALSEQIKTLKAEISELKESDEDKTTEIESSEVVISEKNTEIDCLKVQLKEQGLKVLDANDLPTKTKESYDRIKAIVPLMGAIHAELKDTNLTDEQRKEKADELCDLDDERRNLWDKIDDYLNNFSSVLPEDRDLKYSENPFLKGMEMARRRDRLVENIGRNKTAAENHKKNNKPDLEQKALEKVIAMEAELSDIDKMIDEAK